MHSLVTVDNYTIIVYVNQLYFCCLKSLNYRDIVTTDIFIALDIFQSILTYIFHAFCEVCTA